MVHNNIRINIFFVLAGNFSAIGSQALLMILLIKIFPEGIIGHIALGTAIAEPILKLFNLNLRVIQATDQSDEFKFKEYLTFRITTTFLSFIILILTSLIFGENNLSKLILLLIGILKCVESISDIFYGLYQKKEEMHYIGYSRLLKSTLALLLVSTVIYFTENIICALTIQSLVPLLIIITYDLRLLKCKTNKNNSLRKDTFQKLLVKLHRLFLKGLPLGITMCWLLFNTNIPRYILAFTTSREELGIYSALSYFLVAGQILLYSFGTVVTPRLANYYQEGNRHSFIMLLSKFISLSWLIAFSGTCLALMFGEEIITFFYTPLYARHTSLLIILAIASGFIFSSSLFANGINATRKFKSQLYILPAVSVVGLISCCYLIPRIGLTGAGISTLLIAFTQAILRLFLLQRLILKIPLKGAL